MIKSLKRSELLAIHSFGDCYVSLHKGEGFGLTIFDAFNLNKEIITTNFGGQIDYLGKNYKVSICFDRLLGAADLPANYLL